MTLKWMLIWLSYFTCVIICNISFLTKSYDLDLGCAILGQWCFTSFQNMNAVSKIGGVGGFFHNISFVNFQIHKVFFIETSFFSCHIDIHAGIKVNARPSHQWQQKSDWASQIRISVAQIGDWYFPFIAIMSCIFFPFWIRFTKSVI